MEKYPDKLDKLFTLQNIANLQGIGLTLDFGFTIYKDLTKSAVFNKVDSRGALACTQTLFYFSFRSFPKIKVQSDLENRACVPLKKSWLRPWI